MDKRIESVCVGFTKDNEIILANATMRDDYFTASFDTVRPILKDETIGSYDWLEERWREYCDFEMDDTLKVQLLQEHDCSPSELPSVLASIDYVNGDSIFLDNSIYGDTYELDFGSVIFESVGGGQHDTRDELDFAVNQEVYDNLHILWDEHHLKTVTDKETLEEIEKLFEDLRNINTEYEIEKYINSHREQLFG